MRFSEGLAAARERKTEMRGGLTTDGTDSTDKNGMGNGECPQESIREIREGMRFVSGVLKHSGNSCRTDGKWVTINLLAANQQVDYGRCSWIPLGVTLRFREIRG